MTAAMQAATSTDSLSPADKQALSNRASDLSDLDVRTVERAHAGFRHAYQVAQRVSDGTLDPLSA